MMKNVESIILIMIVREKNVNSNQNDDSSKENSAKEVNYLYKQA